ncbi:hypothetical protein A2962_00515 [Candidatus Woesebacteria bacterium RIFCSPLOWO2_01_FULL_39_61]|uniref:Toxin n=1 Tax=Candidatus Woesebacteria bacterium RIFCSPHIGHO2_02_FULL_39_13 TaxID=1802505 RepID=A0A1F7Z252_9BACT|nr:MAG: hypothetical protein A3D01_01480 [Candidatus Woesebacteria bacterium RIFCSPHIGHO2_02_FULL_39_13]OGM36662.1 MAG: hypothetical protein A3E13_00010 [Candidatus Woesebacteria bacterium RIFCSPHIGHO2_12_FULL_40_20]OGM68535.1 MAG: hypothetical protein A2962_00515 [Candidatus Woesebacteria bacterium RIFCSPLOWO2_01_FULL_39_61]OGM73446.1 MAG: hypothetical protein A3H19_00825 [Candidatus Woesebacteria bacterium RIFCSPLOWO2_12_FULL_39_9]
MRVLPKTVSFEWDKGNLDKSYEKHGTTPKEAEEIFVSEELYVLPDVKHSHKEKRFIALGKTQEGKQLFVVFVIRKEKIRIVSARKMHKKEAQKYEKVKKDSKV